MVIMEIHLVQCQLVMYQNSSLNLGGKLFPTIQFPVPQNNLIPKNMTNNEFEQQCLSNIEKKLES